MASIPRDNSLDGSLALLREGYEFIGNRCRRYDSDIFATRLMLRPAICISGPEAAGAFYAEDRFTRRKAMPPSGELLDSAVAAVELLNVLRPTVAVARYVTFAALALHEHPQAARQVRDGGAAELEQFVQEVRRLYPFFTFVGGRFTTPFVWRGHRFDEGQWVLLDLYGTNRDARAWGAPEQFRPERFRHWQGDPFTLIRRAGESTGRGIAAPANGSRSR